MNIVTVNASKAYSVIIGCGLYNDLGSYIADLDVTKTAVILSDSNVWPLYGQTVSSALTDSGFQVLHYVIPAGEESKNGNTYLAILNFLAQNQISRTDLLIALGGGVVGDLTGFIAATYLRGISYIQLPTTLLAMVDSSVGGKTAIDLPAGKNLVGAFYQPKLVLCDIHSLSTLPTNIFRDGCAEVIKYAILYDPELFDHLVIHGTDFDKELVISRCVSLKRDVVAEDEFDRGSRQKLNLGHTIGHGIETASNFSISHGTAVAIGTAMITRAAEKLGICNQKDSKNILNILELFHLPTTTAFDAEFLFQCALKDKKRSGDSVSLIIPESIGNCTIRKTPIDQLMSIIKAGY